MIVQFQLIKDGKKVAQWVWDVSQEFFMVPPVNSEPIIFEDNQGTSILKSFKYIPVVEFIPKNKV